MLVRNTTGAGQLAVGNPYRPGGTAADGDSKPAELVVVVKQIQVLDQVHFHRSYEHGNQDEHNKNWVNLWSELCASVVSKGTGRSSRQRYLSETPRTILGSRDRARDQILGAFPVGRAR